MVDHMVTSEPGLYGVIGVEVDGTTVRDASLCGKTLFCGDETVTHIMSNETASSNVDR